MVGFAMFYVSGVELICRRLGVKKKIKIAGYLSDNLTALYMIHWTVIGWLMISGLPQKLTLGPCFGMMLLVTVLSLAVLYIYRDFQASKKAGHMAGIPPAAMSPLNN